MNPLRKLLNQTAIYGLSNIIARLLNYLLVPLHTRIFLPSEYGAVTEMYAYAGFLFVLLTYGTETAFFRYINETEDKKKIFSSISISLIITTLLFLFVVIFSLNGISEAIGYAKHKEYIMMFAFIAAFDVLVAIPFANLRNENRPLKFATIKIINIIVNIGGNLLLLWILPKLVSAESYFAVPKVEFVFAANLAASTITFLLLIPELRKGISINKFSRSTLKTVLRYAAPLLLMGLAGIANEVLDRVLLKHLLTVPDYVNNEEKYLLQEVGIYGANYKIAVLMTILIQTYRYAAEPFFFSNMKNKDAKKHYSDAMRLFLVFSLFVFLSITSFVDIIRNYIEVKYHEGVVIIPIVLLANLCLGVVYNFSVWYKVTNKTSYGAYLAIIGAGITIISNILLVPVYGYIGSAWATLFCYSGMMFISYFWGQKVYPIDYKLPSIFKYVIITILIYYLSSLCTELSWWAEYSIKIFLLTIFVVFAVYKENLSALMKKNDSLNKVEN